MCFRYFCEILSVYIIIYIVIICASMREKFHKKTDQLSLTRVFTINRAHSQDCADAQADLSICFVHVDIIGFVMS